jgi:NAD-dependent dihydropyrimidine dehydrogenase PreA subunit
MEINNVISLYFSPNNGTKKAVKMVAESIISDNKEEFNLTLKSDRSKKREFHSKDLVIVGFPVYSDRIPSISDEIFKNIKGNNTPVIALAVYGNRDYGDALLELKDSLQNCGFKVISAAAIIAKHCLNTSIASSRPDEKDNEIIKDFVSKTMSKVSKAKDMNSFNDLSIKGSFPYKERKKPLFPSTNNSCIQCGLCAKHCPVDAIDFNDCRKTNGSICILCGSCINICPTNSRSVDSEAFKESMKKLENNTKNRREIEAFI